MPLFHPNGFTVHALSHQVLHTQFEEMSHWNKSVLHSEVVETLSPQLDLVYTIGMNGGGGLIKSRYNAPCPIPGGDLFNAG